jgi:hypothetical protein
MNDRFERQQELVPTDRLAQLAAIGVRRIQLIDFDRVEPTNVTTQGYLACDVGQLKVDATRRAVEAIDPTVVVQVTPDRFRPKQSVGEAVFCSVDTISARASIWRSVKYRCGFWVDGRMLAEVIRVLVAVENADRVHYDSTLFAQSDAHVGRCTARSTIYAAGIAAGLMVHQFARWLRRIPVDADVTMNLLSGDMVQAINVID